MFAFVIPAQRPLDLVKVDLVAVVVPARVQCALEASVPSRPACNHSSISINEGRRRRRERAGGGPWASVLPLNPPGRATAATTALHCELKRFAAQVRRNEEALLSRIAWHSGKPP